VPNSRGNLRTVKTYTVILVYRRELHVVVTLTSFTLLLTDVLSVSFVRVFHLIKFVSFCCYPIFVVNKDIHSTQIGRYVAIAFTGVASTCQCSGQSSGRAAADQWLCVGQPSGER